MPSDAIAIVCNSREVPRLVKPNDLIYVDDGKIVLLVLECEQGRVKCEVKQAGVLGSYKSLKLPSGKQEHLPILTHHDSVDLTKVLPMNKCDYIAVPYAIRKRDIT